jgi:hypothetical protein
VTPLPATAQPAWRLLGACARGTSHESSGLPCQDAYQGAVLPGGLLVIAVADGAGSARRADEGAQCIVAACVRHLAAQLEGGMPQDAAACKGLLDGALEAALCALSRAAAGGALGDLASTLLLALATPQWLAVLQVGDGAVVCRGTDGALCMASQGGGDGYVNETAFVTSPGCAVKAHRTVLPAAGISGIAVMTDGIQMLAVHHASHTAHEPFFRPLFEFAQAPEASDAQLAQFLGSPRVCERTDDDKTLVIAVRDASH